MQQSASGRVPYRRAPTQKLDARAAAGNFFSAAFEDTCLALVGASGGVFGMVGLFIADMVVNFSTIKRCAATLPSGCFFLA